MIFLIFLIWLINFDCFEYFHLSRVKYGYRILNGTVYSVSLGSLLKVTKIQNIFSISLYRQFKEPKLKIGLLLVRQFTFPFSVLKMKNMFWNLVICNHPYTQYHWLCDNHCNGLLDMVFFQRKKSCLYSEKKKKVGAFIHPHGKW